jgi:hypothetical protein
MGDYRVVGKKYLNYKNQYGISNYSCVITTQKQNIIPHLAPMFSSHHGCCNLQGMPYLQAGV